MAFKSWTGQRKSGGKAVIGRIYFSIFSLSAFGISLILFNFKLVGFLLAINSGKTKNKNLGKKIMKKVSGKYFCYMALSSTMLSSVAYADEERSLILEENNGHRHKTGEKPSGCGDEYFSVGG